MRFSSLSDETCTLVAMIYVPRSDGRIAGRPAAHWKAARSRVERDRHLDDLFAGVREVVTEQPRHPALTDARLARALVGKTGEVPCLVTRSVRPLREQMFRVADVTECGRGEVGSRAVHRAMSLQRGNSGAQGQQEQQTNW